MQEVQSVTLSLTHTTTTRLSSPGSKKAPATALVSFLTGSANELVRQVRISMSPPVVPPEGVAAREEIERPRASRTSMPSARFALRRVLLALDTTKETTKEAIPSRAMLASSALVLSADGGDGDGGRGGSEGGGRGDGAVGGAEGGCEGGADGGGEGGEGGGVGGAGGEGGSKNGGAGTSWLCLRTVLPRRTTSLE